MKKRDIIFIVLVLFASVTGFFIMQKPSADTDTVRILKNGEVYAEKPVDEDCEIDVDSENTVVIENGNVYMKNATCPDKLCQKQGKISDNSKKIVCLPNKVIVEVTKKSDMDTVVK